MSYKEAGKPKNGQAVTARGEKNGSAGGRGGKTSGKEDIFKKTLRCRECAAGLRTDCGGCK